MLRTQDVAGTRARRIPESHELLVAGWLRPSLAVFALWTAIGLLESTKTFVWWQLQDQPHSWRTVLTVNMPWWWIWAMLTPPAILVARTIRLDSRTPLVASVVHVLAAVTFGASHLAIAGLVNYATTTHTFLPSAGLQIEQFINGYLVVDILTYGAIVAGWYALEFRRRLREEEVVAVRLEAGMAEARLEALRRELNPHFLFNALNTVSALVKDGNGGEAVSVLARLGDLLRCTLDSDSPHVVPLTRELDVLRHYLAIEECRLGDRLSVRIDLVDGTESAMVPALALQPLVENAVRYGVASRSGPGTVSVEAEREGPNLALHVSDDGPGFAQRTLLGLDEGVGLSNTRKRLSQLYGDRAELRLQNLPNGGARVTLRVPYAVSEQPEVHPEERQRCLDAS